jgi:hypothetical protein
VSSGGAPPTVTLSAIRDRLYTRMEETSFRSSMTILAGVVLLAAAIAVAGILLSRSPAAAHRSALGPPPGTRPASVAPTSARATPSRTATPSPSPSPSHAAPAPTGNAAEPGAAAAAPAQPASGQTAATAARTPSAPRVSWTWPSQNQIAAWWAWWREHQGESGGYGGYGGGYGHGAGWGRGGFGRP